MESLCRSESIILHSVRGRVTVGDLTYKSEVFTPRKTYWYDMMADKGETKAVSEAFALAFYGACNSESLSAFYASINDNFNSFAITYVGVKCLTRHCST